MAEENKKSEAPEGFWDDFQAYLMAQFAKDKGSGDPAAPAPEPVTEEPAAKEKPKRKSWFSVDE